MYESCHKMMNRYPVHFGVKIEDINQMSFPNLIKEVLRKDIYFTHGMNELIIALPKLRPKMHMTVIMNQKNCL